MTRLKIAVTGAGGFVGRHVLAELARHPVTVTAAMREVAKLGDVGQEVRVVELDISHTTAKDYERLGRPDVLIHLAWGGLPNYESLHHFETELPRQYLFLKTLVDAGLPTMLVTGTCFEYGMQSGELPEELLPLPINPYGYAKDVLRRQLEFLRSKHSFALTWARLFYMYGEGQAENSLFSQIRRAVERGDKVFDMSGGEQVRDYLPVTQVASSLVTIALQRANFGVVNVCSGKPISVKKLVQGWIKNYGWSIGLNLGYYPYSSHEPMAFWGNASRLRSIIKSQG
jgi:nucleoside-diphosphate-sugar epimerase